MAATLAGLRISGTLYNAMPWDVSTIETHVFWIMPYFMTSWLQKHSSAALWDFRTLGFSDVFFTLFSTLQSKYLSLQLMNSCQHYKSGCLRNKQQKPCRFFNIYSLQPTVLDLSPSATFRLPHHGNLKLCSWHIHSSNGLARWFLAIVTSGGSLESQVTTSFKLEKTL